MRKPNFKKFVSSIMAASVVAGSISAINSLAASPQIYVDFSRVDSTTYRADFVLENMPSIHSGGIHIEFGEGWDIVMSGTKPKYTPNAEFGTQMTVQRSVDLINNRIFFAFTIDSAIEYEGVIASFYVTPTSVKTPENSTAHLVLVDGDILCTGEKDADGNYIDFLPDAIESSPVMLKANQFIVGDADGNGSVNSLDASEVLGATSGGTSLVVDTIAPFHTDYFPKAICAGAPDANQDGYINSTDADDILDYYSAVAVGNTYSGNVGKIDVYETFQN
ncbi:MAG: hypothetical protein IJX77_09130 [Ruminococcus sp.]|nr:hypothetical protein [Ruminococcus sp.]